MAQVNRLSTEYNSQLPGNPDVDYSTAAALAQQCSLYPTQQSEAQSSVENANLPPDNKPALPPKPFQGPPIYREPPCPPIQDEGNHPDICINTASAQLRSNDSHYALPSHSSEKPDRLGSRTHAWVQEHKSSGKLVGEKLSSLQRKLRSFLSQSSNKECTELEKSRLSVEDKPRPEMGEDNWNFQSTFESTQRSKPASAPRFNMNPPSSSDQNLNYISASSFGSNSIALSLPQPPVNHTHSYKSFQSDRHPFAAPGNLSEQEDSTDPDQMRDTCNKFFAREQRISWTNYLNPRNSYSNNIKSSYDYDKLVPKEVIGRPSQDKKPDISSNREAIYGAVAPFPSFSKPLEAPPSKHVEPPYSQAPPGSYYAKRVQNFSDEASTSQVEVKVPNDETDTPPAPDTLPNSTADCGDTQDLYKSSSESGRGTMHSSMHGSKSVVSPHSSGVSAASNLDTSIDSDHSTSGALWGQQNHACSDKRYSEDYQVNKRHIYEASNASGSCRQSAEKEAQDDATSESLSVTPPLPPLSPAPSPPGSGENSPKLSSRAKYKLSLSASALNTCYTKSSDHQQKICDMPHLKPPSGKKQGTRRTTNMNQAMCRHRNGKSSQFSKSSSSTHRLGITHSTNRKSNSSPPSRHHSRNQLAYQCYMDNGDPELTSTTTGLDMESLLDDDDEYSSDLSATASTMEPNEVSMIRKQLEGLETMYSEILRLLGVKNSCNTIASSLDVSRHSRRKLNGSLSSLTRSSVSRGNHSFMDKRGYSEKRRSKDCRTSSASKRLQRLESHVVTLARSVAHLSSEMRTQHVLVQELENMRQDVTWVQERMRLIQLAQGCNPNSGGGRRSHQMNMHRDWDNFHKEVIELLNPSRAKKLTKFFGDEPPLIRQFLKRLGYEKYAANFENEKVGIKELPYLTEERLQKMGIPMGPRIRILQEAHSCSSENQYKVYIV